MTLNKQYSSFSQSKGLLWREWYDGILNQKLLPPVGCVIDLTDKCNLHCGWCNARFFRAPNMLSTDHVKRLVDRIADWGCLSCCYAGGGEPTLHPDFAEIVEYTAKQGLEVGISTNGTVISREAIDAVAEYARFCGFSIDAGFGQTWTELKGGTLKMWDDLMWRAFHMGQAALETPLDLTYKMMLVPENQYEIVEACRKAKKLEFKSFFVRPAAYEGMIGVEKPKEPFDVEAIKNQYAYCESLETDWFKVYSSFGRVGKKFERINLFDKCRASPLIGVFCADGYAYLCIDSRGRLERRLCKHMELFDYWGSKEHLKRIEEIDLSDCPRCAFCMYQQQIQAYEDDYMFRAFP